jgi:hypothetical protein
MRRVVPRSAPAHEAPLGVAAVRGASAATPRALAAQTNADEALELLARLRECRGELSCLALLEPAASTVLNEIAAELDEGEASIASIVDEPDLGPEDARRSFDALRAGLARLHREQDHASPFGAAAPLA